MRQMVAWILPFHFTGNMYDLRYLFLIHIYLWTESWSMAIVMQAKCRFLKYNTKTLWCSCVNSQFAWSLGFFLHFTTASLDLIVTKTSKISNSNLLLSGYNSLRYGTPSCSLQTSAETNFWPHLMSFSLSLNRLHRHWPHFTSWNISSSILPQGISTCCNLLLVCYFSCIFQVWLLLIL